MSSFRRWLLRLATATSMLLCMVAIALWVQSYAAPHGVYAQQYAPRWLALRLGDLVLIRSEAGGIVVERLSGGDGMGPTHTLREVSLPGLAYVHTLTMESHDEAWIVSYWLIVCVLLVVPTWLAVARCRRPRPVCDSARCCASCRYNLTGNVSGVCPECGTGCELAE